MASPPRQAAKREPAPALDGSTISSSTLLKPPLSPTLTKSLSIQSPPSPINFDFSSMINSQDLLEMAACPCCKQCIDDRRQQTLSGPRMITDPYTTIDSEKSGSMDSDDEDTLPRGVAEGLNYHPRKILVEGWLHKKGTGKDWLGSKSWKPRWARLVMARLDGFDVEVPLLMIYWYEGTSSPSNVIILDSTVAFPIDMDDKLRWDAFRFDIRNAKSVATGALVNRTFCGPKKARDAWIYAISQALLMYEKANDKARKAAVEARRVSPQNPLLFRPMSPPYEEVWSGDRFVSPGGKGSPSEKRLASPPRAPLNPSISPRSRNTRPPPSVKRRSGPKPAC